MKNTYDKILWNKRMDDISNINIQDATNELVEMGYTDRTIKEALSVVNQCMEIAIVNHIIRANPCVGVKIFEANIRPERRVLTAEEQNLFLQEVKNEYYYEAYAILLCTGMRIGEFSGLWWSDIDFENKCIHINRSMTTAYINGKKIE